MERPKLIVLVTAILMFSTFVSYTVFLDDITVSLTLINYFKTHIQGEYSIRELYVKDYFIGFLFYSPICYIVHCTHWNINVCLHISNMLT